MNATPPPPWTEGRPVFEAAREVSDAVRETWPGRLAARDWNDRLFALAYARAWRNFNAIDAAAREVRHEDATILLRPLLSVVVRALYLVQTDDPIKRNELVQRYQLKWRQETLTRLRQMKDAGIDEVADELAAFERDVPTITRWFTAQDLKPGFPSDADLARDLGFKLDYVVAYRRASEVVHFSFGAAISGLDLSAVAETGNPEEAEIALDIRDAQAAEETVYSALATYGHFLVRADPKIAGDAGTRAVRTLEAYGLSEQSAPASESDQARR